MKKNSTFHVFFTTILIFGMPFVILAQQNSMQIETNAAAEADAEKDINKPLWLGTGCVVPVITAVVPAIIVMGGSDSRDDFGIGAAIGGICILGGCVAGSVGSTVVALSHQPAIPTERLIGKSPEYVRFYTDAYRAKTRRLQATYTGIGIISGGVGVCLLGNIGRTLNE